MPRSAMPRPAPAQFVCGALTVICSTLVILLLPQARSGAGVVVATVVALALGLLVAVRTPAALAAFAAHRARSRTTGSRTTAYGGGTVPVATSLPAQRGGPGSGTAAATGAGEPRIPQTSPVR